MAKPIRIGILETVLLIIILNSVICGALYVHKIRDYNDPTTVKVQKCRATCMNKFIQEYKFSTESIEKCSGTSDCFMCWDYCKMLHDESITVSKMMCSDYVCHSGCKYACSYFKVYPNVIYKNTYSNLGQPVSISIMHPVTRNIEQEKGNSVMQNLLLKLLQNSKH